jgi:hypothetical protein
MDTDLDNQMQMGLTDMRQREIMQKVAFTDELLNQLKHFAGEYDSDNRNNDNLSIDAMEIDRCHADSHDARDSITYPVKTAKYNEAIAQNILEKNTKDANEEEEKEENSTTHNNDSNHNHSRTVRADATLDEMVQQLIASRHLSQDKLHAIEIMYKHFHNIRNGTTNEMSYTAPMLMITGGPGTGKSWLIRSITDLAELMELETPVKTSFMGIAALNIGGFTMNSFLDVPTEMSRNTGTTKRIIPWNTDRLQEFKQRYDVKHLSVLIIDEISMVKPWMFAYLDERFKEARQIYDKCFGGVAVIMFGDFDQQQPVGGSSLPHLAITLLEKEYQQKHGIFYTKQSQQ